MSDAPLDDLLTHAFAIDEGERLVIPEPFVKQMLRIGRDDSGRRDRDRRQ